MFFPVTGYRLPFLASLVFLALLVLPRWAAAQTWEVVGLVMDGERGEPITGVEISTQSGKLLGTTNSKGRFAVTVNNRGTTLFFRRQAYKDLEIDLATRTELIDMEVSLDPAASELAEKTVTDTLVQARRDEKAQTIEELELMQGMRIDLNDHLRQLPGVSGMSEFSKDISVYGSRTQDVTQFLGQSRIPNMRHLDIGFPGNQSVVNPRLLKSVTMSDNLASGPVNQGNASALVFDLKDGDPDYLHADVVLGTINREFNLSGYWNERTFLLSGRYLDSDFLKNLGLKFYTDPKDARIRGDGSCDGNCRDLETPFKLVTGDLFFSTFKRDSSGAFGRFSLMALSDDYTVNQDVALSNSDAEAHTLVEGYQDAWMATYENIAPTASGERQIGLSLLRRKQEDVNRDTLPPFDNLTVESAPPWYVREGAASTNILGDWQKTDWQAIVSWQQDLPVRLWGARTSLGGEFDYSVQARSNEYYNGLANRPTTLERDLALANALLRLRWSLGSGRILSAAAGANTGWDALSQGEKPALVTPMPLATLRYTHPWVAGLEAYAETGMRQAVSLEPTGFNEVTAHATPSGEIKLGVDKPKGEKFRFTSAIYSRLYQDPALPSPNVFWNYAETQKADLAYVRGVTGTATYLPSHHFGLFVNASFVDGDYKLADGGYLPWESNRSLDLVSNMRLVPRKDSLLSFIATYTVSNGMPLYQHRGLWNSGEGQPTLRRSVEASSDFATVSRQRLDMRINLDLKSKWKPLDGMRFFFEADNIFADLEGTGAEWLGGVNQRQRGWSRSNANGDLVPVVTRGLGLFIFFGVEAKLTL